MPALISILYLDSLFLRVHQRVYPINFSLKSATFKISHKCHIIALEKGNCQNLNLVLGPTSFLNLLEKSNISTTAHYHWISWQIDARGEGKTVFQKDVMWAKEKELEEKVGKSHGPFFESNCNPGQQEGLTIWWGSCNPRPFEGDCICFYSYQNHGRGGETLPPCPSNPTALLNPIRENASVKKITMQFKGDD